MKKQIGENLREHAEPATLGENPREPAQPARQTEQDVNERRRQAAQRRQRQEQERQKAEEARLAAAYAAGLRQRQEEPAAGPEESRHILEQEMATISAINPTVKGIEDLAAMDKAGALFALLRDNPGLTLSQAYLLTYFDQVAAGLAQRAARAAAGKLMGTRHLQPMPGRGNGDVPIPPQTLEMYRSLFPGKNDMDFARHWKRKNQETEV